MSTATDTALGTHSEVGKLRAVMVHRPDLAHERLSPTNARELLFDDVIWVRRARQEHDAFVDLMRERGVEVLLVHELLAETLQDREAREWLLSRRIRPEDVTLMFAEPIREWLNEMPAEDLATRLTGGVTVLELPEEIKSVIGRSLKPTDFVLPPLPNQLFTRDTSAWLYGGVSLSPMFWPARRLETLNVEAIYRFHPRFRDADFQIWFGGADHDWGVARLEGGDMMPAGDGVVLIGMGERSTARAVSILARNMFAADAARLVIGAQMPRDRAAMHLDTVFTFCDRGVATLYELVVAKIVPILFRPAIGLGFDAPAPGLMRRTPPDASAPIVDRGLGIRLAIASLVMAGLALAIVAWGDHRYDLVVATTMGLTTLSLMHIAAALEAREPTGTIFSHYTIANRRFVQLVLAALVLTFLVTALAPLQRIFDTTPLTSSQWGICLLGPLVYLAIVELGKLFDRRRGARQPALAPAET
jgi:arginine deiminase